MAVDLLLEMAGVTKAFPGTLALDGVSFDLRAGEVHALVGENGAGKSTLLKVLGGVHAPTAGVVRVGGRPLVPAGPGDAVAAGIAVIHQEFTLVPQLTVAENVFLGREPRHRVTRRLDARAMRDRTAQLLDEVGATVDPREPVAGISVAQQQLVEIARALSTDARVVVLDEPTAALAETEVAPVFALVRRLRDQGRGVVYVSHRLAEIFEIADRVTVLRDGRHVATLDVAATTEDELVRLMVGRDVGQVFARRAAAPAPAAAPRLRVQGLSAGSVRDVSFEVGAGEVVVLAGLDGSGRQDVARALYGMLPPRAGTMTVDGRPHRPRDPAEAMRAGVAYLVEDRKALGLFPELDVTANLTVTVLRELCRRPLPVLDGGAERALVDRFVDALRIRTAGSGQEIARLSGGNQQKVLLGRALAPDGVRLLVLCEPTRGVDIGAKGEIHRLVDRLTTEQGLAVLLLSSDLLEVTGMADRVVVLHRGRVAGELDRADATSERVTALAVGGAA